MTHPPAPPGRRSLPALLLAAALLASCAGTFEFRVQSSEPSAVSSVFVLFGDEAPFAETDLSDSRAIAALIAPPQLEKYDAWAQYELVETAGTLGWSLLGQDAKTLKVVFSPSEDERPELVVELSKSGLEDRPAMGLAVIVRTNEPQYKLKVWPHIDLADNEETLILDVTSAGIAGIAGFTLSGAETAQP